MQANVKNALIVVAGLALVLGFWLMILGPKRDKAAELGTQVSDLEAKVAEQEQRADFAEQARQEFPSNYHHVVVLGKAVPPSADSASLLVQLNQIAGGAGTDFRALTIAEGPQSASAPAAAPAAGAAPPAPSEQSAQAPATEGGQPAASGAEGSGGAAAPAASAPATEAGASTLAIGATVGPAGLEVLPYKLRFDGDFFGLANFISGLDKQISTREGRLVVDGRLTTIDGFSLASDDSKGFPALTASLAVTTYLTPPEQGLTGGATPSGPVPATPGQTALQPASTGASQ